MALSRPSCHLPPSHSMQRLRQVDSHKAYSALCYMLLHGLDGHGPQHYSLSHASVPAAHSLPAAASQTWRSVQNGMQCARQTHHSLHAATIPATATRPWARPSGPCLDHTARSQLVAPCVAMYSDNVKLPGLAGHANELYWHKCRASNVQQPSAASSLW